MDRDEIYEDTWEDKKNEWLPFLKHNVLSTAFAYARYTKGMEEIKILGMKNSLNLQNVSNKIF